MKQKKIIGLVMLAAIFSNIIFDIHSRPVDAATNASTTVNGSITATIISVSVPTTLAFTVDPNEENGTFSSEALIENNTYAPIEVSLYGGGSSFYQSDTSEWKPTDYLPSELNWDELGKDESESSLALGVRAKDQIQWRTLNRTTALWVKELKATSGYVSIGELDPLSSASMTFEIYHGYAFSEPKACAYDIIWTFSLAE